MDVSAGMKVVITFSEDFFVVWEAAVKTAG
jgi:hypothetical protein